MDREHCLTGRKVDDMESIGSGSVQSVDEAAIRVLMQRLRDAWAQGDGEAYAACFAEDSDYITYNGMHLHGRKENAQLHRALFRGVLKGSRIEPDTTEIYLLSDTIALVHTANRRKKSLQTFVLVKGAAGWLIRSFQNTRSQPLSIRLTRWMQRRAAR
ncbi:MAG: SgcJ/EcaC family oxidoreductase [Xanthomonadales bacterium]|nr:SgcJ/EcaC family oxidoreductase [Xanthomonadales bacterium]